MDDLISRQTAISAVSTALFPKINTAKDAEKALRELPAAHRPVDEWCTDCSEYDTERKCCPRFNRVIRSAMDDAQPRWIPVKTRPMTAEERQNWEEYYGFQFDDEDAVIFDCPMPQDGQAVWVTTKNGYLFKDVCENDDGLCGLEENGDWDDIVAWMPVYKPEPYREDGDT